MAAYVLQSTGISRKSGALIVIYSQEEKNSFVFCCFENPSIAPNFGTTGAIQVGFSANCTFPNEDMFDFD